MSNKIANNKRIAKNTLILYLRMALTMVVSFFTARVTLQALGVIDYGIMNVVGGLLGVTTIITGTMASATQRFFSFFLGKNDIEGYKRVFSLIMSIYLLLALFVLLLGEFLGSWLINSYLNIPQERIIAAFWLYQATILVFILGLLNTPYTSSLIAYEKMDIYAYMTFYDAGMKLLIAYSLYVSSFDKLETLAILSVFSSLISFFIYHYYCVIKIEGCRYSLVWDRELIKKILSYTGWNLFGSTTGTLNSWGMNLVLNIFFGPVVNAAKGIGDAVNFAITSFCTNFYQAVSPQIIKTFSSGDEEYSRKLVCDSSKFSFFLLSVLSIPTIFLMKELLQIWLGRNVVTNSMIMFAKLMLVFSLINILEQPITTIIRATGNIRNYQVAVGVLTLLTLPLTYVFFKIGYPAEYAIISMIIIYFIAHFIRIFIVKRTAGLSVYKYFSIVLLPILKFLFLSVTLCLCVDYVFKGDWVRIFCGGGTMVICCLASIYLVGLTSVEKKYLLEFAKAKLGK